MEVLKKNIEAVFGLEWLGVHFEDTREAKGSCGLFSKTVYYYSVPETSTIEVENKELNEKIKTAHGLKYLAKETLIEMMFNAFENEYGEDKEFIEDVKNNIHDYFKFCVKVRTGEVWTKELGDNRIKELTAEIQNASGYTEI